MMQESLWVEQETSHQGSQVAWCFTDRAKAELAKGGSWIWLGEW
jgi:hypothetical protein